MKSSIIGILWLAILFNYGCTKTPGNEKPLISTLPVVTTTAVSGINYNTAKGGGTVRSDGGFPVIERGVVWGIDSLPTVVLSTKTSNGADTGTYVANITGLYCSTLFYLRAYATNATGTAYGKQIIFTTTTPSGEKQLNIYKSHFFDSVIVRSFFGVYPDNFSYINNLNLPAGTFLYVQFDSVYTNLYASNSFGSLMVRNGDTLQIGNTYPNNSFGVSHNRTDITTAPVLGLYSIHASGRAFASENSYYCKFSFSQRNMANTRFETYSFENDTRYRPACPLE